MEVSHTLIPPSTPAVTKTVPSSLSAKLTKPVSHERTGSIVAASHTHVVPSRSTVANVVPSPESAKPRVSANSWTCSHPSLSGRQSLIELSM